ENARAAEATGLLSVPAFFYISDMKVPLKGTTWRKLAVEYAEKIGAEYRLTDKGHLMYAEIPDKMAEDFRLFMQRINI
ncbi:MAG: alpha/beta hydrolase, partial [Ruminococcus sp.]